MDIIKFQENFLQEIANLEVGHLEFYQFGSSLRDAFFKDLDILIIYEDYELAMIIKSSLIKNLKLWLPHITCLSKTEEEDLSFINNTQAKKIYPN